MKKVLQNQVLSKVPSITPKRKYIKKAVESVPEQKPEIIVSNEIIENENENNVQNKRINNLVKAREARQEKLNTKEINKEQKINELVESINNEQIEKIKIKNEKLKSKLLKLI